MKLTIYKINGGAWRSLVIAMCMDAVRGQIAFELGFALGTGNVLGAAARQRAA